VLGSRRASNGALLTASSLAIFPRAESIGVASAAAPRELLAAIPRRTVVERRMQLVAWTHGSIQLTQVCTVTAALSTSLASVFLQIVSLTFLLLSVLFLKKVSLRYRRTVTSRLVECYERILRNFWMGGDWRT